MRNGLAFVLLLFLCLAPASRSWCEGGWTVTYALGPEGEYIAYVEPGVMEETGFMAGIFGGFTLAREAWSGRLGASYVAGELDYRSDPDSAVGGRRIRLTTPGSILNLRGTGGWSFGSDRQRATLFAGLGYRFLVDDLPDYGGLQGYRREQTYTYVPLGLEWVWRPEGGRRVEAALEYDWFLGGENRSLSYTLSQDSGYGLRASVRYVFAPLDLDRLPDLSFSVEPFFQYWSVAESDWAPGPVYEPENSSTTFGLRAGVEF
jgi:hypothetical protein